MPPDRMIVFVLSVCLLSTLTFAITLDAHLKNTKVNDLVALTLTFVRK